jgi:MraZ protein
VIFTGVSEVTVDAKGRLAIPAKYRNAWDTQRDGGAWFSVPWPGGVLRLYTEGAFNALSQIPRDSFTAGEDRDRFDTAFFSQAERLEMDASGRILLPKRHLRLTALTDEVVVVGARNRLEVWPRASWEAEEERRFATLPEVIRKMDRRGDEEGR